jgi:hypothetical protein
MDFLPVLCRILRLSRESLIPSFLRRGHTVWRHPGHTHMPIRDRSLTE